MKKITSFFLAAAVFGACQSPQTTSENKESAISEQKTQEVASNATPVEVSKTILIGKFSPSETKGFVSVPSEYCSKPMHIQEEVLNAYLKMRTAALAEGVNLLIISGTRTFNDQKGIWERKWEANAAEIKDSLANANKILLFS